MVKIEMTRVEILELMKDLPESHWMNERLLQSLSTDVEAPVSESYAKEQRDNDEQWSKTFDATPFLSYSDQSSFEQIADLAKNAESEGKIDEGDCVWELYGYYCNKVVDENAEYQLCSEHIEKKCTKCGKQAVHGCPEELQFVCGEPLCANCHHRSEKTYR